MQNTMATAAITAIFIAGFIIGSKKGFIKSATGCIIYAGSFILSLILARIAASAIYSLWIDGAIRSIVNDHVNMAVLNGVKKISPSDIIQQTTESIPAVFQPIFNRITVAPGSFNTDSAVALTDSIMTKAFKPVIMPVLRHAMFIVAYIISALAARIITKIAGVIRKIPGMGKIDKFLGGLAGVLVAVAILTLSIKAFVFLCTLNGGSAVELSRMLLKASPVIKFLANI